MSLNKILKQAYNMKWSLKEAPHGLIDILRGCNCKCAACYNNSATKIKPYDKITEEIDLMLSKRNVSTIGIIGGEPLLHPDIFKIISYIKQKGVCAELLTNGILIDNNMSKELASAGLDFVLLHIDKAQIRPDLKCNTDIDEINRLRDEKAKILSEHGIDVGMSITIDKNDLNGNLDDYIKSFEGSKYINTFLVTLYKDIKNIGKLKGDLESGIVGDYTERDIENEPTALDILEYFAKVKKAIPYWYISGHINKQKPHWLMYLFAVSYSKSGILQDIVNIKYSYLEKLYLRYYLTKYKKYPTFKKRNTKSNLMHILLNGIMGGFIFKNLKFLFKVFRKEVILKRILVQELANVNKEGVEYCENCPDAIIKNGKLVPNCISDHIGEQI